MNWRTLLWWWFIMLCLSQLPASLLDSNCTNVFQNIAFAMGAVTGVFWIIKWVVNKIKEKHSYTIFFRKVGHDLSAITTFQEVEVGTHYLEVMVQVRRKVSVEHADLRFVIDTKHLDCPRSDADTAFIEITEARDIDIPLPRFSSAVSDDRSGGVDLYYSPGYSRVNGDFIRVKIKVEAKLEWEGFLSFRESRNYYYHPFRIVRREHDLHVGAESRPTSISSN